MVMNIITNKLVIQGGTRRKGLLKEAIRGLLIEENRKGVEVGVFNTPARPFKSRSTPLNNLVKENLNQ